MLDIRLRTVLVDPGLGFFKIQMACLDLLEDNIREICMLLLVCGLVEILLTEFVNYVITTTQFITIAVVYADYTLNEHVMRLNSFSVRVDEITWN